MLPTDVHVYVYSTLADSIQKERRKRKKPNPVTYHHPSCTYLHVHVAYMIQEEVSLDARDSVDVVAIVNGSVAELCLYVSQLRTQL